MVSFWFYLYSIYGIRYMYETMQTGTINQSTPSHISHSWFLINWYNTALIMVSFHQYIVGVPTGDVIFIIHLEWNIILATFLKWTPANCLYLSYPTGCLHWRLISYDLYFCITCYFVLNKTSTVITFSVVLYILLWVYMFYMIC